MRQEGNPVRAFLRPSKEAALRDEPRVPASPAQGSPPTLRGASSPPDAVRLLSEGVSSPLSMDTASSAPGRGYVGNAAHRH